MSFRTRFATCLVLLAVGTGSVVQSARAGSSAAQVLQSLQQLGVGENILGEAQAVLQDMNESQLEAAAQQIQSLIESSADLDDEGRQFMAHEMGEIVRSMLSEIASGSMDEKSYDEVQAMLKSDRTASSGLSHGVFGKEGGTVRIVVHTDYKDGSSGQYLEVYVNGQYDRSFYTSLGKPGKFTPKGEFTLKEKDKWHVSSTYAGSTMHYYHRLADAWGIHETPHETMLGKPASMGCTRISSADAQWLWNATDGAKRSDVKVVYLAKDAPRDHEPTGTPPYITYKKWNDGKGAGGTWFKDAKL